MPDVDFEGLVICAEEQRAELEHCVAHAPQVVSAVTARVQPVTASARTRRLKVTEHANHPEASGALHSARPRRISGMS
jgi:hypothetical protein